MVAAERLAKSAESQNIRFVFAESCSGGAAAAAMTGIPGISRFFCGSLVTYRQSAKTSWLDVEPLTLAKFTAESAETTRQMAQQALGRTVEANFAAAITGHLGPQAPVNDGLIFVCVAAADPDIEFEEFQFQLAADSRVARQLESAEHLIRSLDEVIRNNAV